MVGNGTEYLGTRSITQTGHICQEWILDSSNTHTYHDLALYPDNGTVSTLVEVRNYCRNHGSLNEGNECPWCFTLTGVRWDYRGIPRCNSG